MPSKECGRTIRKKRQGTLGGSCYPNGFETTLTGLRNTHNQRGMQLAAVGVTAKIEHWRLVCSPRRYSSVQKPEDATIPMLYCAWSPSTGDADWGTRPILYSKAILLC